LIKADRELIIDKIIDKVNIKVEVATKAQQDISNEDQ
jgi:hypothetical protein